MDSMNLNTFWNIFYIEEVEIMEYCSSTKNNYRLCLNQGFGANPRSGAELAILVLENNIGRSSNFFKVILIAI